MSEFSTAVKHIKFSYDYDKLPEKWENTKAVLKYIEPIRLESQNSTLIEFDTRFRAFDYVEMFRHPGIYKNCHYSLPKSGKYLFLLFKHESGALFFTQRRWTIDKEKWYMGSIGEEFVMLKTEAK